MKSGKAERKFRVNPARELIESVRRVAARGINPGDTIIWVLNRRLSDVGEGEVVSYLKHHEEDDE